MEPRRSVRAVADEWTRDQVRRYERWLARQPHHMALPLFLLNSADLDAFAYYRLLRQAWERAEMIGGLFIDPDTSIGDMFQGECFQNAMMTQAERRKLMRLRERGERITLWRGTRMPEVIEGGMRLVGNWSWTTSEGRGRWFADRYGQRRPVLLSGTCHPNDIIALLDGRGEEEVIIRPRHVKEVELEMLPERDITNMDTLAELVRKYGSEVLNQ